MAIRRPEQQRTPQPQLTPADPKRVALLAVIALVLLGAAGWGIARAVRGAGTATAALTTASDTISDSARLVAAYADTGQLDPNDTAGIETAPPIHPPEFFGTWYHGDSRSQYGDSLTLVLWDDGRATAHERRYILDRTGWHVSRVEREGSWQVRHRSNRRPLLCTDWRTPTAMSACAAVLLTDSVANHGSATLDFAGRHWRQDRNGADGRARADTTRGTTARTTSASAPR